MLPFYRDLLGFRLTDYYSHPFQAYFLHVNPRHHSLAFIQTGKNAVHHMMMELFSFDDVGQGYDIALRREGRVATTLGRHTSDFITSFYTWTPSDFMVEYGWGARSIDVDTWQAVRAQGGPEPVGPRPLVAVGRSSASRAQAAARQCRRSGYRRPVQVMDGNFNRMPGVCPWWDELKAQAVGLNPRAHLASAKAGSTVIHVSADRSPKPRPFRQMQSHESRYCIAERRRHRGRRQPKPKPTDILVKIKAIALNRADLGSARGDTSHGAAAGQPIGSEFAGEVIEVGAEVRDFKAGDRVMCHSPGSHAEIAVSDYGRAMQIPDGMSYEQAATLPIGLNTLHNALITAGRMKAGEA